MSDYTHEPGIYLGMPDVEYHTDDALGSTDIRAIRERPWKWQMDRLNPSGNRVTEDMKWGSALHCRVLEGKTAFDERYAQKPQPEDYGKPGEDVLVTADHLKRFLRDNGVSPGSMTKPDLIAACRGILHCPVIFDEVLAEWQQTDRVQAGYELTAEQVRLIEIATWQMHQNEYLAPIMLAGSLMGGAAEVSVFYEDDGIRRKNRFDYAIPPTPNFDRDYSLICDLKSFANFRGENAEEAALETIWRRGYDLQAVDYLNGFERGRELFRQGKVYGDEPFDGYLKALFEAPNVWWAWIMVQKDAGFETFIGFLDRSDESYRRDMVFQATEEAVREAVNLYRRFTELHGADRLWPAPSRQPLRVSGALFPTWRRGY